MRFLTQWIDFWLLIFEGFAILLNMKKSLPSKNGISEDFDKIAKKYDLTNRVISLGFDISWRKKLLKLIDAKYNAKIIDLACGTGDVSFMLFDKFPQSEIIGADLSEGMLAVAKHKAAKRGIKDIEFVKADILDMPFDDTRFDVSTMVFGLRNLPDLEAGLKEISRVMKPSGRCYFMEFSVPRNPIMRLLHRIYIEAFIPVIGSYLTGDVDMYQYLGTTIKELPQPEQIVEMMKKHFTGAEFKRIFMGMVTIYLLVK